MKISNTILKQAIAALDSGEEFKGFCLSCGAEHDEVEPDAEGYECESCGELQVYGAEQIVIWSGC